MSKVPYFDAGKGDTPRSCNSKAYLDNYQAIFRNKKPKKSNEKPPNKCK